VGLFLWLLVVGGLAFGWQQNLRWLTQWSRIMILPYVAHAQANPDGQSIPTLVTRLVRHVPALMEWPSTLVNWLGRGVLLILAIAGMAWARHPLPAFQSRRYVLEIGAVAAFMLWTSQRTWVPHYVTLVLTLSAVGMLLEDPEEPQRIHRRAWWALVLSAGLMALTGDLNKLLLPWCWQCGKVLGASFWASVLLLWTMATSRSARPAAA